MLKVVITCMLVVFWTVSAWGMYLPEDITEEVIYHAVDTIEEYTRMRKDHMSIGFIPPPKHHMLEHAVSVFTGHRHIKEIGDRKFSVTIGSPYYEIMKEAYRKIRNYEELTMDDISYYTQTRFFRVMQTIVTPDSKEGNRLDMHMVLEVPDGEGDTVIVQPETVMIRVGPFRLNDGRYVSQGVYEFELGHLPRVNGKLNYTIEAILISSYREVRIEVDLNSFK